MNSLAWFGIVLASLGSVGSVLAGETPLGRERVHVHELPEAQMPGADAHAIHPHEHGGHAHAIETENLFGFVLGSDTEEAGARTLALETVGRFGKRAGSYRGFVQKLEYGIGATDDLSLALSALGDHHRLRRVPDFEDVPARSTFSGIGAEVRWRILDRRAAPFGLTLHLEPSLARIDETSGQAGRKLGSESKLILDREFVPDTLFGAVNLVLDGERMKERRAGTAAERAAVAGVGAALAYRVSGVFIGAETRLLRAYEGIGLRQWQGQALYVGPTLFARLPQGGWLAAAWNVQVAGRQAAAKAGPGSAEAARDGARRDRRDHINFERHQVRLKIGFEF